MSLVNVRDAVLQSRFPSPEAMVAWLSRAVGNHWTHLPATLFHARQAVMSCPLEGRAYIYLAKLDFLNDRGGPSMQNYVEQALRVRPFDGAVLYAAAGEAYLAGDSAKWLEYAKRAFHSGRPYQRQLMADLIHHTAPAGMPAMAAFLLREFQPDLAGVRFLAAACAEQCGPEQLVPLRRCWAEMAENRGASHERARLRGTMAGVVARVPATERGDACVGLRPACRQKRPEQLPGAVRAGRVPD